MNARPLIIVACWSLSLMLMTACATKKKPATESTDAATEPFAQPTAAEQVDKDVVNPDYATPGEPLPGDENTPAAPASAALPGSVPRTTPNTYPGLQTGSVGYPDYDTPRIGKGSGGGGSASGGTYAVKRGDSLWSISRQHGTTVSALAGANGISESAILKPGQHLKLPGASGKSAKSQSKSSTSSTASSGNRTYTVKAGDSYSTIAKKHGTSVTKLKEANNATSDVLREGQTLLIP